MCIREVLSKIPFIGNHIKKKPLVSVVRMAGIISDSKKGPSISFQKYKDSLDKAFDTFNTKAVVVILNSPGGSPTQSALIGNYIRARAQEKDIPVFAFVEDLAASGGYWIAAATDEIYAQETSILGSIGVISASFGFEEFIGRYDIKRRYHTAGQNKGFMDPFLPEKTADVKRLNKLQKDLHISFINWVKERRGEKLNGEDNDLFDGSFWLAKEAIDKGMADNIGEYTTVMKEKYGDKVKFIECSPEKGLFSGVFGGGVITSFVENISSEVKYSIEKSRFGL